MRDAQALFLGGSAKILNIKFINDNILTTPPKMETKMFRFCRKFSSLLQEEGESADHAIVVVVVYAAKRKCRRTQSHMMRRATTALPIPVACQILGIGMVSIPDGSSLPGLYQFRATISFQVIAVSKLKAMQFSIGKLRGLREKTAT